MQLSINFKDFQLPILGGNNYLTCDNCGEDAILIRRKNFQYIQCLNNCDATQET